MGFIESSSLDGPPTERLSIESSVTCDVSGLGLARELLQFAMNTYRALFMARVRGSLYMARVRGSPSFLELAFAARFCCVELAFAA